MKCNQISISPSPHQEARKLQYVRNAESEQSVSHVTMLRLIKEHKAQWFFKKTNAKIKVSTQIKTHCTELIESNLVQNVKWPVSYLTANLMEELAHMLAPIDFKKN